MNTVSDNKMHEQQGSLSGHTHMSFLIINGTAFFTIFMLFYNYRVRNVFPKYEEGAKRLS